MILRWLSRRRAVRAEADFLLERGGRDAYREVFTRSRDRALSDDDRLHWQRIRRVMEKRLGIAPHVDTATRMAERADHL